MTQLNICLIEQKNVIARALLKVAFSLDMPLDLLADIVQLQSFDVDTLKNDAASILDQEQCYRALLLIGIYEKLYLNSKGNIQFIQNFLFDNKYLNNVTRLEMCKYKASLEQLYAQVKISKLDEACL